MIYYSFLCKILFSEHSFTPILPAKGGIIFTLLKRWDDTEDVYKIDHSEDVDVIDDIDCIRTNLTISVVQG